MKENAVKKISRIQNLRKHLFERAKIQRGHSPNKLEAKKIPLQESRELDRATIVQTLDDLNLAANTFGEYLHRTSSLSSDESLPDLENRIVESRRKSGKE